MNTQKTMEYLAACLVAAQEELNREKAWKAWKRNGGHCPQGGMPNKALIQDNLRNVARTAFRLANRMGSGWDT